jgi:excinuclease ABC subunit A
MVVEHNLKVIKTADWIINLGRRRHAGKFTQPAHQMFGGEIVAAGTPEDVAAVKRSYTGAFLKPVLGRRGVVRKKGIEAAE